MPITGQLRAKLRPSNSVLTVPQVSADFVISNLSISLEDIQYRNIFTILDYLTNFSKYDQYRKLLPTNGFDTSDDRKLWWRFILQAVTKQMEHHYFTWDQVSSRKVKRKEYISLYKRSKKLPWLDPLDEFDAERMEKLESEMDIETVIFYRELAYAELEVEKEKHNKQTQTGGWYGWLTGGNNEKLELEDEERQQLYAQIGYTARQTAHHVEKPSTSVKFHVNLVLQGGHLLLYNKNRKIIRGQVYTYLIILTN
jgi:hypothetical protein